MSYLVVLIVDDPDHVSEILDRWEAAGAPGVTILESTGLGRVRRAALRDDLPLMPSLRNIFAGNEIHHRTLFSVVPDEEMVDRLVAAVQEIAGDLNQPHSGFLFVVPVVKAIGLGGHQREDSNSGTTK